MSNKRNAQEIIAYKIGVRLRAYIKEHIDQLPDYWQDKGTDACLDGIHCMIVSGKYSDEEIAEFYGCPVMIIPMVRVAHKKTIDKYKKEHEEMLEAFGEMYENTTFKAGDREGILRLMEFIVEGRSYED